MEIRQLEKHVVNLKIIKRIGEGMRKENNNNGFEVSMKANIQKESSRIQTKNKECIFCLRKEQRVHRKMVLLEGVHRSLEIVVPGSHLNQMLR